MTHIDAMKQGLEALEVEDMACRYEKEATPEYIAKAITSLRQAIAEAEAEKENTLQALHNENERLGLYKDAYAEQKPVAWREIHGKVIKALAGIVNVHTPDKLFDLDAIPREPVMGLVQQIKVAIDAYQPQRTEQEPVIDKSAAIRIATALGWEPKRTWVGLTDEEKHKTWYEMQNIMGWYSFQEIAQAIEAKLKQKNGYAEENT